MALPLRQSTASQEILLGPFVDDADGDTTISSAIANTDIKIWKHGATTLADKNSGGATHISGGRYYAVLDATDTDTIGMLEVHVHIADALPVRREFIVYDEAVYDVLFGTTAISTLTAAQVNTEVDTALADIHLDHLIATAASIPAITSGTYLDQIMDDGTAAYDRTTDSLQAIRDRGDSAWASEVGHTAADVWAVGTRTITGGTVTLVDAGAIDADSFAADAINDAALAADAVTSIQSGLATAAALTTVDDFLDTEIAALTTNLATANTNITTIDDLLDTELAAVKTVVDAILVDTDVIGALGAGLTAVPWNAAWDAEVQSEATDALNAYDPPTNTEMEARTLVAADYVVVSDLSAIAVTLDDNAIDADTLASDLDLYTGTIKLVDDDNGTTDRWVVMFRKNGVYLSSGITTPRITVVNAGSGAVLISAATLTQVGSTIFWQYGATGAERITSGVAYGVTASATIDAATRTIGIVEGRDTNV
jgi:hypothetical protein